MKVVILLVIVVSSNGFDLETMLEKESKMECSKNGKNYEFGEEWRNDHMRYKCGKWGMYEITGCETGKGQRMEKGEVHVDGNIVRACTEKGSSVGYKESICGMWGAPECSEMEGKWRKEQGPKGVISPSKHSYGHTQHISSKKQKESSPSQNTKWNGKMNSPVKSDQPKVEWITSNNGQVSSGKISYKSETSWEPEVTQLRRVTMRDGKVVDTPHSLATLTVPVHTVMRMKPNRRMTKMKWRVSR